MTWVPFYLLPLLVQHRSEWPRHSGASQPLPPAQSSGSPAQCQCRQPTFAFLSAGLCALPVLTQTPSTSSSLRGSAKLTCTLSSEHSTYYIECYQERVGQAPRYLMKLTSDGSVTKGDGIPDCFSASSSGADRYLTITSIQSEDETEYICGVNYKTDGQYGYPCDPDKGEVRPKPPSHALRPTAPG